jgi:hypothetical protein
MSARVLDQERNIAMYSKRIEAFAFEWNLETSYTENFSESMRNLVASSSGIVLDEHDSNLLGDISTTLQSQAHLLVENVSSKVLNSPYLGSSSQISFSFRYSVFSLMTSNKLLRRFNKSPIVKSLLISIN